MRKFLAAAFLLSTTSTMASEAHALKPEWGTIFPASKATSLVYFERSIDGAWTPTVDDIYELETILSESMEREIHKFIWSSRAIIRPSNYYRQYGGIYQRGKRLIIVNGFHKLVVERDTDPSAEGMTCTPYGAQNVEFPCDPTPAKPSDYWRTEVVGAYDGGCNFFHALFDVDARRFIYVMCNGSA